MDNRENIGLYRGKRVDNGEWVEGGICQAEKCACILVFNGFDTACDTTNCELYEYKVIPETIGPCLVNHTDKNGKKIFVDDIHEFNGKKFVVKLGEYQDFDEEICGVGWYTEGEDGRQYSFNGYEDEYLNIIGNIHDNPELLKS